MRRKQQRPTADGYSQLARDVLDRMRQQGQLPPGRVPLGAALGILDGLERRTTAQSLLRRELRRLEAWFMDKGAWANAEVVVILSGLQRLCRLSGSARQGREGALEGPVKLA